MTTAEFKEANIIDILKNNLFFIRQYKGIVDFYLLDAEYASLISNYETQLKIFVTCIESLNNIADDPEVSEDILVSAYFQACNGFCNNVFHTGNILKIKDLSYLLQLAEDCKLNYGSILCYLLELRYHKKFQAGYFSDKPYAHLADFVCPVDTEEYVYDEVAKGCLDDDDVNCTLLY